jgi:hypothetical protein
MGMQPPSFDLEASLGALLEEDGYCFDVDEVAQAAGLTTPVRGAGFERPATTPTSSSSCASATSDSILRDLVDKLRQKNDTIKDC